MRLPWRNSCNSLAEGASWQYRRRCSEAIPSPRDEGVGRGGYEPGT
jgi:hypothetical protein